ncbi:hypothetical protein LCGC14_2880480 [marine sediment metagenome]|uniref:Uncharacterized protein n=1 Tax=marine sediment metagenome TaxID=412755 RepID=A0A0F9ARE7_9ZZZZ
MTKEREGFNQEDRNLLRSLAHVIMGNPKNREDLGLVGDVKENSQFRRTATKVVWALVLAIIGTWGTMTAQVLLQQ